LAICGDSICVVAAYFVVFFLRRKNQIKNQIIAIPNTPPTTPPIIAPVLSFPPSMYLSSPLAGSVFPSWDCEGNVAEEELEPPVEEGTSVTVL